MSGKSDIGVIYTFDKTTVKKNALDDAADVQVQLLARLYDNLRNGLLIRVNQYGTI